MTGKKQQGQALTETIVSMSALVIFFLWASTFYLLNQSTIDATMGARLSVWYQSLFGSASGLTSEQLKERASEMVGDVYVNKQHDISRRMTASNCAENPDCYVVGTLRSGVWHHGVETVAGATISPTFTYPSSRSSSFARRLGLDTEDSPTSIKSEVVSIPVNPNLSLLEGTRLTGSFADYGDADNVEYSGYSVQRFEQPATDFKVSRRAALLSNTGVMVPDNDEQFQTFIGDLSADGAPLSVFEPWRATMAGFDEIDPTLRSDGLSTVPADQSTILPTELGVYED